MMRLKGMKRFLSVVLCAAILTGGVYSGTGVVKSVPVSAMTLAELQSEKQANADKIAKMQKELDDLGSNQQEQADFQKTLEEKISLQQSNLQIVDEELTRLEDAITDKEQEICDLKNEVAALDAEISNGLEEFKQRLRVMYVQGNDSLASALVGSTDFYDLLSKYDLMSRVAKHDNELVSNLKEKLETCQQKQQSLEEEKNALAEQKASEKQKKEEFSAALEQLQDDYAMSTDESIRSAADETHDHDHESDASNPDSVVRDAESQQIQAEIRKSQEAARATATTTTTTTTTTEETTTTTTTTTTEEAFDVVETTEETTTTTTTEDPWSAEDWETTTTEETTTTTEPEVTTIPYEAVETTTYWEETTTTTETTEAIETEPVVEETTTTTTTEEVTTAPETTTTPETPTTIATTAAPYNESQFAWPVPGFYYLSSGYGPRWDSTHGGIDIAGGGISGASVVASRSGTVIYVSNTCTHNYVKDSSCGCGGGYGNYCIIEHDGTYSTVYGHMASLNVSYGQHVNQGDVIGYVGSTGWSTGYHLHFEIRVNGSRVDPTGYLY